MQVLLHHRNMASFIADQRNHVWNKLTVLLACEERVGFMGVGVIGGACASTDIYAACDQGCCVVRFR